MKDAHTKGGTLASGTTHKKAIYETPEGLGMGLSSGKNDLTGTKPQRPAANPVVSAPGGHKIK